MSAAADANAKRERDATQAKVREARRLKAEGLTNAQIAARMGDIGERRVGQYLQGPHEATDADGASAPATSTEGGTALVRKRIRLGTFRDRAQAALDSERQLRTLDRGLRMMWLDCATSIHKAGGEDGLVFKRDGFRDLAFFAKCHEGTEDELRGFFAARLLEPLDGGAGIAIPEGLGLRAWTWKKAAAPARDAGAPPRNRDAGGAAGQRSFAAGGFVQPVPDAPKGNPDGNFGAKVSEKISEKGNFDGNISEISDQNFLPISENGEISALGRPTTTATTTEESSCLGGSGSESRATDGNFPISENFLPEGNPADENFAGGESPAVTALAGELAALAGLPVPVQPRGLGFVDRWVREDGMPRELLLGVYRSVMARERRPEVPDWAYFDKAVRDALKASKARPDAPAAGQAAAARPPPGIPPLEAPGPDEPVIGSGSEAQCARVARQLRRAMEPGLYRTWLSKTALVAFEDGVVTHGLPTDFQRDWVKKNYGELMLRLWRAEDPAVTRIEFVTAPPAVNDTS